MPSSATPAPVARPLQRLVVRHENRLLIVPAGQVDWIESADNYALIHEGRTTHILRDTLTRLEARLAPNSFLRISRRALVNLDHVREIQQEAGAHFMVLPGDVRLPITRGIREVLACVEVA